MLDNFIQEVKYFCKLENGIQIGCTYVTLREMLNLLINLIN